MDFSRLLENTVTGLGYELIDWERSGKGRLLRVFVDKPGGVGLEDCARISNHLSRVLAVEGVEYERLEISSPGLDRVLTKAQDFERFKGEKARVKLRLPLEGQRNFIGVLHAVNDGKLELEADGKRLFLDLVNIEKARLIPNI